VEIFLNEEFLYGVVVQHILVVIRIPFAVFQKNSPLMINFSPLWRLIKLASDVNTMGGDLP
jgi:hypothetical protein